MGALFFPYKYIALVLLMVQTTSSILVLRYSRTVNEDGQHYVSTTAVVMSEVFKVCFCHRLLVRWSSALRNVQPTALTHQLTWNLLCSSLARSCCCGMNKAKAWAQHSIT